jgi:hypothetical protein
VERLSRAGWHFCPGVDISPVKRDIAGYDRRVVPEPFGYVRGTDALRSADQIERAFDVYVRPRIGTKSIYDLQRSDIKTMLAEIAKDHGPVMADRVLAYVRKAFNWQMINDDHFKSPIVRGMARTKLKQRARKRILSDEEICDVWAALETADVPGCYPRFLKSLLLNVTRRNESSMMGTLKTSEILEAAPKFRMTESLRACSIAAANFLRRCFCAHFI